MARRIVMRVLWSQAQRRWGLHRPGFVTSYYGRKVEAVDVGAAWGRQTWHGGAPAQLIVHNKSGRGRGQISFERTYGRDPRRSVG